MEKYFALIKNNLVQSIILVEDVSFLELIKHQYDEAVDVTDLETRPHIGDGYYSKENSFIPVHHSDIEPENSEASHLKEGTEEGFEPFRISNYMVSYSNGIVTIGCKQYPAKGLMDAVHKLIVEGKEATHCFIVNEKGPAHGKFQVTWEDTKKVYEALKKVKL